jgi:hypothetical protein
MMITRRAFMRLGTSVGGGFVVQAMGRRSFAQNAANTRKGSTQPFPIPVQAQFDTLSTLSRTSFSNNMRTTFRFYDPEYVRLDLVLSDVTDLLSTSRGKGTDVSGGESFTLTFTGPLGEARPQRTYNVAHDKLGNFDLFVVPGGSTKSGTAYVAIINRIAS